MRFVLSEVEHLRRHPRPPVPNSPGKINVGYCTGSSLFQKGSHQKTSKSKKTPDREPEKRNETDVKSNKAVHHNPDGEPLGSEVEHLRRHPRPPVPNSPGSHQKTSKSKKTPDREPEKRNETDVKSNKAVHHNPDGEPLGSEVEHLRRHPRPPVPNSPGKINVGYCTGSSLFQKAVHHNPDGEPLGSEVEHLRRHPRPPVPNSPGKINVGYCTGSSLFQKGSHQKTSKSEVEHLLRPLPRPPVLNSPVVTFSTVADNTFCLFLTCECRISSEDFKKITNMFVPSQVLARVEVEHLLRPLPRPPVRNSPEVHQFPYWKPLGRHAFRAQVLFTISNSLLCKRTLAGLYINQ
ncbi:hypothetical protein STEG23_025517 [Scotinomys teguina]